jgi:hypothetical protein
VHVDVVIGILAMQTFADKVGQLAEREEIGVLVKIEAFLKSQALAIFDLIANGVELTVEHKGNLRF